MQKMGGMCSKVTGVLVLLAGLSFLANGLGHFNHGILAGGVLLTLFGLGKLAHSMDMCPNCSAMADEKTPGKKR